MRATRGITIRTETRHTIVLLAGTGVTTALGLVYGVYATRALGDGAVGTFTHALSVVAFLQIAFGPINGTVAKFAAEYNEAGSMGRVRSLVREVTRRVGTFGFVALVVALAASIPLAQFWKYPSATPLMLAMVMTFATLLLSVARGALRGLQRFGALNVNTIFESGCRLAVGAALLAIWTDASIALLAYVAALLGTLLLSQRQLHAYWSDAAPEALDGRAIRRFALPMFIFMLASAGFQNVDMLVVKRVLSITEADSYGVAFYLTGRAIAVLVTPFTILLLPMLASLHGRGLATQRPFLRVCGYFVALASIPLALFALVPDRLMHLLYENRFADAAGILLPLAIARMLGHLCHIVGLAQAAAGRFGFLYVYSAALVVQSVALGGWGRSADGVVEILLWSQGITLVILITFLGVNARRTPPEHRH